MFWRSRFSSFCGLATLALLAVGAAGRAGDGVSGTGRVKDSEWKAASTKPLEKGEIDALVAAELKAAGAKPAARTSDEQFLRRVSLDLTGKLPRPADVTAFLNDKDPDKRAKLIDKLLDSDDYATHWARYWRDVFSARLTSNQGGRALASPFERWMRDQLKANKSWAEITRTLLTATGQARYDETDYSKVGPMYFLASHYSQDFNTVVAEQASEASRIFLGIQINCAQCHDHPSDVWKREQFHEFAAYFGRLRPRLMREEQRFVGIELVSSGGGGGPGGRFGFGEYRIPDKDNPRGRGTPVSPKFIDGTSPSRTSDDAARREHLAKAITGKDNPWYAAAFVNRLWGQLVGQPFTLVVDDMGPQKDVMFRSVITRVAGSFRGSDYDMKALLRAVCNSDTYQRQTRLGESSDGGDLFAAVYPTRLSGHALWDSLVTVLGPLSSGPGFGGRPGPGGGGFPGGFGRGGLEGTFKSEFNFDPSLRPEDVEGSIPQALLMMNSPAIQQRIQARGDTLLARILKDNSKDDEALEAVYLRTLARKPTAREKDKCLAYIKKVGSRSEAFEDVLWALINSTEFQTKR